MPRHARLLGPLAAAFGVGLSGCVPMTPGPSGNYVTPVGGSPVTPNPSPYSKALVCMAEWGARHHVRPPSIAVGRISDLTGKLDDNGGRTLTQGAMLMAVSALGKAGVPVVERYETDVSKLEYNFANNKLIAPRPGGPSGGQASGGEDGPDYRPVHPGQVAAADYFITGGVTELNANIRNSTAALTVGRQFPARSSGGATGQNYVLSIGMDLRLVDTTSLRVVDIVSYQKQVIGRQVGVNLFAFFGNNVLSATANQAAEEPSHLAVRSLVERGVLEMVSNLYGAPGPDACLRREDDPMRETVVTSTVTGAFVLGPGDPRADPPKSREDPQRWRQH